MNTTHRLLPALLCAAAVVAAPVAQALSEAVAAAATTGPGAPALEWQEPVLVARGGGHQGPWRMNDSEYRYVDDPAVALAATGAAAVVWVDQSEKDVRFQWFGREGRPGLPRPSDVSRSPETFSWLPRVVVDERDGSRVYVLWQEIIFSGGSHGGDALFARSTDGGATFEAPRNLSRDRAGSGKGRLTPDYWHNGSLDLAAADGGRVYAAWTDYEGGLWLRASQDGGRRFAPAQRLNAADDPPARGPALAADGDTVHLAWTVGERRDADIHLIRSTDGGRSFSTPRRVHESPGHADAPGLALDGDGVLHLVYAESPDGPFQAYHVRHTRLEHWDGPLSPPAVLARPQAGGGSGGDGFASASFPAIASGSDGRLFVTWELFRDPAARPRALGYSRSGDGGASWAPPDVVPGSVAPGVNGSLQGLLMQKLALRSGHVAVVDSKFVPDRSSRIRLLRAELGTAPAADGGGASGRAAGQLTSPR